MKVRFVDVSDRFKFEKPTLTRGKDFMLRIPRGIFGTAAEARVQRDRDAVVIRPSKGELVVNDQLVQGSTQIKQSDLVCLRADDRQTVIWEYQEDFVAAKRARQERERAEGVERVSPYAAEGEQPLKVLAQRIRFNDQGLEISSFFSWKRLRWQQLDTIEYSRSAGGAAAAGGVIGGLIGAVTAAAIVTAFNSASKPKSESEFGKLFDRGNFDLMFNRSDSTWPIIMQGMPANCCVVLGELLEQHAPFDLLRCS